ncbi:MAG: acyl-CoA dehydrogenase family protein [Clostridiales Family XIII bacterium]|uniref:acyl-CoA dehydrogenase family protein n=1 Tax=Hominibacterium faecale TaxID=2839743 RepID=UPI0022B29F06|nr:acyl-CoA dehydrogenase family protein [Hominibacterium faecale]MCI7301955.1 acyl-CoA dehydrogenase family protein [Clostridia bacterium]MDY3012456.1 acyl-CoA dehydrogenase family protein [Clostridiales Family XIII bacterium]
MYLTEKHQLFRKLVKQFAQTELKPELLDEIEETNHYPREILDKMAECGFFGVKIPKKWGGAGFDTRAYVILNEELASVSAISAIYANTPNSLGGGPLLSAGTEEQLEKYLIPLAKGKRIISFALTEPGAGSDAGGMQTTAVKDGDHYILNGRKCFITHAPEADYAIIFAKTDPQRGTKGISAFIVDMTLPGVSTGLPEEKMGIIGGPTSDIILKDVRVHKRDRLGEENRGFINAMKTLDGGRIGVAAQSIGVAKGALEETIKYSQERTQFGRKIKDFQAISFTIAGMATKLEAARLLTYQAAYLKDTGQDASKAASMAKWYASEACNEICAKAIQVHGGYGFIKDYKVERFYRDCRVFTIYEGTSQVQQMVIAGQLLKK